MPPFQNPLRDPEGNPVAPIVVLVADKKTAAALVDAIAAADPSALAAALAKLTDPPAATSAPA